MDGIGARLCERCQEPGVSGVEVARRVWISPRCFSFYVNDRREPEFATLLAENATLERRRQRIRVIAEENWPYGIWPRGSRRQDGQSWL